MPEGGLEKGAPVEWIERDGIGAIVSSVPARLYAEEPLAGHMGDPAWLIERIQRHNRVLLEVMAHAPVAPCRFGTLFQDRAGVSEAIALHRPGLEAALKRVCGRAEWAVKAYMSRTSRGPGGPSKGLEESGIAYLAHRMEERAARREAAGQAAQRSQEILASLSRLAEDLSELPLRDAAREGGPDFDLILNVACLARRCETRLLESRLGQLAARERRHGITLAWSGPWPPYSFVGEVFPSEPVSTVGVADSGTASIGGHPTREFSPERARKRRHRPR